VPPGRHTDPRARPARRLDLPGPAPPGEPRLLRAWVLEANRALCERIRDSAADADPWRQHRPAMWSRPAWPPTELRIPAAGQPQTLLATPSAAS